MATRAQIIELVIRQLAGGDPQWTFRWGDEREVGMHVDQIRDVLVSQELLKEYFTYPERNIDDTMVARFEDVPVSYDAHLKLFYSDLPARNIGLPNNRDIVQISTMRNQIEPFVPVGGSGISFALKGPVNMLGGNIGWRLQGNRVWLHNVPVGGFGCGIMMMMVTAGNDSPDGVAYCQADLEDMIVKESIKKLTFGLQIKDDKSNDRVDK
jgi:hypothetical protein